MKSTRDSFISELATLEARFAARPAELEYIVRDPERGVEGYVVVFNSGPGKQGVLGPCGKGGTRITPTVDLETVRM